MQPAYPPRRPVPLLHAALHPLVSSCSLFPHSASLRLSHTPQLLSSTGPPRHATPSSSHWRRIFHVSLVPSSPHSGSPYPPLSISPIHSYMLHWTITSRNALKLAVEERSSTGAGGGGWLMLAWARKGQPFPSDAIFGNLFGRRTVAAFTISGPGAAGAQPASFTLGRTAFGMTFNGAVMNERWGYWVAGLPGGVIARLPGGVIARLPGGVIARLPGGVIARLPGGVIARLPGVSPIYPGADSLPHDLQWRCHEVSVGLPGDEVTRWWGYQEMWLPGYQVPITIHPGVDSIPHHLQWRCYEVSVWGYWLVWLLITRLPGYQVSPSASPQWPAFSLLVLSLPLPFPLPPSSNVPLPSSPLPLARSSCQRADRAVPVLTAEGGRGSASELLRQEPAAVGLHHRLLCQPRPAALLPVSSLASPPSHERPSCSSPPCRPCTARPCLPLLNATFLCFTAHLESPLPPFYRSVSLPSPHTASPFASLPILHLSLLPPQLSPLSLAIFHSHEGSKVFPFALAPHPSPRSLLPSGASQSLISPAPLITMLAMVVLMAMLAMVVVMAIPPTIPPLLHPPALPRPHPPLTASAPASRLARLPASPATPPWLPWARGELPWARGELPWARGELPWARGELPWARVELPWARGELPWARVELPWARGELPWARGELPWARGELPWARGELPWARGALPWAGGELPWARGELHWRDWCIVEPSQPSSSLPSSSLVLPSSYSHFVSTLSPPLLLSSSPLLPSSPPPVPLRLMLHWKLLTTTSAAFCLQAKSGTAAAAGGWVSVAWSRGGAMVPADAVVGAPGGAARTYAITSYSSVDPTSRFSITGGSVNSGFNGVLLKIGELGLQRCASLGGIGVPGGDWGGEGETYAIASYSSVDPTSRFAITGGFNGVLLNSPYLSLPLPTSSYLSLPLPASPASTCQSPSLPS
ncbi:unnamed protein product [Closterium sp. NIES-54]